MKFWLLFAARIQMTLAGIGSLMIALTGASSIAFAQTEPQYSPAPVYSASPSPSPSPPPVTSPTTSTNSAKSCDKPMNAVVGCALDGTLTVRVVTPLGKVEVHKFPGGCKVQTNTEYNFPTGDINANAACLVTRHRLWIDANVLAKAVLPGGFTLGGVNLRCTRDQTFGNVPLYRCEARINNGVDQTIFKFVSEGNPEEYFFHCLSNTKDAIENVLNTLRERSNELCQEVDPSFGFIKIPSGDGSGEDWVFGIVIGRKQP